ncbi:Queuine tRNA-ribosyltransferase domain-containing 1 [Hyphodiscus hymeniophilus]|uniref:Queuine tRNA-ribosyltransferase accessory subunit 2 n=1 Tax=Hyphodiscus hymeniophilus TaxID=353542 RepID=A0A9P6VEK1_9HELO|nr:Queuine tRNA-ribosyltransferase domain-containing 1 [Hyphodiscus hymeniophilus]
MGSESAKRVFFELLSHVDPNMVSPRLGRLRVHGRKGLETPDFIAVSSRGVVPHITPDVVANTPVGGFHMALEDCELLLYHVLAIWFESHEYPVIEKAAPPIMKCPGSPLHAFNSLPTSLITLLAPRRTPAVTAPNGNSNTAISIFTSTGFQVLTNKSYIDSLVRLRPDIAIALADIPYGASPGTKRLAKMGGRTQEWLTRLINEKTEDQAVFAPVLPIDFQDQSEYINFVADDLGPDISGLAFYDSNLLPDMPATTLVSHLPKLSLDEPTSPHHILRQVSFGMDIFTIPFIGFATDAGIALTFRFPQPLPSDDNTPANTGTSVTPLGIDMWTSSHSASPIPLSTSCKCYTCTSHHRAYVQHLLSAKEMLGWTLIQIHNHHILSEFFSSIRDSIRDGTFEKDRSEFARTYESELPEKSGQGPRIRGYHFKSEGLEEGKKNKAKWGKLGSDDQVDDPLVPEDDAAELEEKGFAERAARGG